MNFIKKDPLQIITFQSYGTENHLYVKGRALEDEGIDLSKKGFFSLLINTYKRFETDEIKNTPLTFTLPNGIKIDTETDDEGYFLIDKKIENLRSLTDEEGWIEYIISYKNYNFGRKINNENVFKGRILIPSEEIEYGVISDIDDTILHTGLTSRFKWRVAKNTLLKRAEKRLPLEGAAELYEKLHLGNSGKNANPIFYVSHSPWNLYLYLEFFLKANKFPKGPILLRDFVNPFAKKYKPEKPQKQREIVNLLVAYKNLNFILIGDSGEHDPDIYMEIAENYPDRILAIYLRDVKHSKKMLRVKGLYENYKTTPVLFVAHSNDALKHAKENGFVA